MSGKRRKPALLFAAQVAVMLAVMWVAGGYLGSRFHLGIDEQQKHCLPYKYYLIDYGSRDIGREGYVAFRTDERTEPFFDKGLLFIKQVKAVAGDRVQVEGGEVRINGIKEGELDSEVLSIVDRQASRYDRDEIVANQALWVMGTAKDSYDSRYWGPVEAAQVVGKVYPIR